MTNFEYWKDRILEINEGAAVAIINGKPCNCSIYVLFRRLLGRTLHGGKRSH